MKVSQPVGWVACLLAGQAMALASRHGSRLKKEDGAAAAAPSDSLDSSPA